MMDAGVTPGRGIDFVFFPADDGIRNSVASRGLGDMHRIGQQQLGAKVTFVPDTIDEWRRAEARHGGYTGYYDHHPYGVRLLVPTTKIRLILEKRHPKIHIAVKFSVFSPPQGDSPLSGRGGIPLSRTQKPRGLQAPGCISEYPAGRIRRPAGVLAGSALYAGRLAAGPCRIGVLRPSPSAGISARRRVSDGRGRHPRPG